MNLTIDENETRALFELIDNCNACDGGCCYAECEEADIDCDECEFTKAIWSVRNKLCEEE